MTGFGKFDSTWLLLFGFRIETIFPTALAAWNNNICFKSGHNWLKNDHLALDVQIVTHSVFLELV